MSYLYSVGDEVKINGKRYRVTKVDSTPTAGATETGLLQDLASGEELSFEVRIPTTTMPFYEFQAMTEDERHATLLRNRVEEIRDEASGH